MTHPCTSVPPIIIIIIVHIPILCTLGITYNRIKEEIRKVIKLEKLSIKRYKKQNIARVSECIIKNKNV